LFQLSLADRKLDEAEDILKILSRPGKDHQTVACSIELAAAREQMPQALELFQNLCSMEKADHHSLSRAVKAIDASNHRSSVDKGAETLLGAGSCARVLAKFGVQRKPGGGRGRLLSRLKALKAQGEAGRRAVFCYLDQMGEAFATAKRRGDVNRR